MGINFKPDKPYSIDVAIKLSLQRALLSEVSPNLRMVAFEYDNHQKIVTIYFYYDREIKEENKDAVSCITAEVGGDFDAETKIVEKCAQLDFPKALPQHRFTVFRRKE